jgi:hypothetical protein
VGQNCRRLQGLVDEAALVFFQTRGCLEYNAHDLPPWMAELDLSYHMHLPLDLPWEAGGEAVADTAAVLADKAAFCRPKRFVLHPPQDPETFLCFHRRWCSLGFSSHSLLVENIEGNDLGGLIPALAETDCRICLDYGHVSAFGQWALFRDEFVRSRLAMLHLYAPAGGHRHRGLTMLSTQEQRHILDLLSLLPAGETVVLEVFSWPDLQASLDIFASWIRNWGSANRPAPNGNGPDE